ncbi:hypothetical protein B0181_00970 [Moraxella caviae]|uniref:Uncharacterized protein n=1 Tax=Moraxella caviae TaxID=34060 RepID=A0A1T0ABK5_9GAMM|nr:hypothetical protein [Moraxella caviae]OOR93083.1 hypothetical protein B0181_00970 [Moraxella caviae]STZ10057.1 Uncharacterised protein [Moraxella caviae]VEW12752.1 Uncharacterised protein [Moraxella caviae]
MKLNPRLANVISLLLFFVGVMAVAVCVIEDNGYAYHAFVLCGALSVLAEAISLYAGNKQPNATPRQKRFILIFQAVFWLIGWALVYSFDLF